MFNNIFFIWSFFILCFLWLIGKNLSVFSFSTEFFAFEHLKYSHETTLSSYVWGKKNAGVGCNIKWKVLKKARAYNSTSAKCYICLSEKVEILKNYKKDNHLNKRSELFSLCRHRKKWLLGSVTWRIEESTSSTIIICLLILLILQNVHFDILL